MPRCPICGEEISSFDRRHAKTKHPEYFHESRKWMRASYLSLFPMFILIIMFFYFKAGNSSNFFATNMILILVFVNVAIVAYIVSKLIRLVSKYRKF